MKYVLVNNGKAVVSVKGSYDLFVVGDLKEEILKAVSKGCSEVVFDFHETNYMDSTGLGLLIQVQRKVGLGKVTAKNVTGQVRASFQGANLMKDFQIS